MKLNHFGSLTLLLLCAFSARESLAIESPIGGDENWDTRFAYGLDGIVYDIAVIDSDIYVGGSFTEHILRWNTETQMWYSMDGGVSGDVRTIAVKDSCIYVGGSFTTAGSVSASHIAMWNTGSNTWSALGSGVNDNVYAIAVNGSTVYAGGSFGLAGGISANHIAGWSTVSSSWFNLGSGLNSTVYAIAAVEPDGSEIIAGGSFTHAGGSSATRIARWNENSSTWSALGSGVNSTVFAIESTGSEIYAGGLFLNAGGNPASRIAMWDENTSTWSPLGSGVSGGSDEVVVRDIVLSGDDVYAAGYFYDAGGISVRGMARWNTSTYSWSPIGNTIISQTVQSIALHGSSIYSGGEFPNHIIKWNGSYWSPLGLGLSDYGCEVVFLGDTAYVAGDFAYAGEAQASRIARWYDDEWSAMGKGLSGGNAIAGSIAGNSSDVFVGGRFLYAEDTIPVNNIARWNTGSGEWSALSTGLTGASSSSVAALLLNGSDLYAGGRFTSAGGVSVNNLALWNTNTNTWSDVGEGVGGEAYATGVNAIVSHGTDIYAGGNFTTAGGISANRIAKWDTVTETWSALGDGLTGFQNTSVNSMIVIGDDIYVGGRFSHAGGIASRHIARWNTATATWHSLDDGITGGLNSSVSCIAARESEIFIGGSFTGVGGTPVNNVARWDGNYWSSLGSGVNGDVFGLAAHESFIYLTGSFVQAGGIPSHHFGIWEWESNGIESSEDPSDNNSLCRVSPNPARNTADITFHVPEASLVSLEIYDVAGRLVRTEGPASFSMGWHTINWNGMDSNGMHLPPGVYLIQIRNPNQLSSSKVLIVR